MLLTTPPQSHRKLARKEDLPIPMVISIALSLRFLNLKKAIMIKLWHTVEILGFADKTGLSCVMKVITPRGLLIWFGVA